MIVKRSCKLTTLIVCISAAASLFIVYQLITIDILFDLFNLYSTDGRCSFRHFRKLARLQLNGYLTGNGSWIRTKNSTAIESFSSYACNFTYPKQIPENELDNCLLSRKLNYIVIIGESNGRGYFNALHTHLAGKSGKKCTPVAKHPYLNYSSYSRPDTYIKHYCNSAGKRGLGAVEFHKLPNNMIHDWVWQARCDVDQNQSVLIEYFTARFTLDAKLAFRNKTGCQLSADTEVIQTTAPTTQEFLLGEFYSDPKPDLFLVFANAHDASMLSEHARNVDGFARLIDRYVRPPTNLVWFSRFAEDVSKKPPQWRGAIYENGTMTRLQWLDAANRIMFSEMRRRFISGRQPLMFLDLLAMSAPVLREFNLDGVHMRQDWYDYVMSFILQTFCEL